MILDDSDITMNPDFGVSESFLTVPNSSYMRWGGVAFQPNQKRITCGNHLAPNLGDPVGNNYNVFVPNHHAIADIIAFIAEFGPLASDSNQLRVWTDRQTSNPLSPMYGMHPDGSMLYWQLL